MKLLTLELEYDYGDIVYIVTDPEQLGRMVTGYYLRPSGAILYEVSCGSAVETNHYAFELSVNRDLVKATSN